MYAVLVLRPGHLSGVLILPKHEQQTLFGSRNVLETNWDKAFFEAILTGTYGANKHHQLLQGNIIINND